MKGLRWSTRGFVRPLLLRQKVIWLEVSGGLSVGGGAVQHLSSHARQQSCIPASQVYSSDTTRESHAFFGWADMHFEGKATSRCVSGCDVSMHETGTSIIVELLLGLLFLFHVSLGNSIEPSHSAEKKTRAPAVGFHGGLEKRQKTKCEISEGGGGNGTWRARGTGGGR